MQAINEIASAFFISLSVLFSVRDGKKFPKFGIAGPRNQERPGGI
jgi:hypothetical protein